MQWQEWSDVIPADELQLLDRGRQQEIEQPLIDLGYLSGTSDFRFNATSFQQEFYKAIQQFRADYFAADLQFDPSGNILGLPTHELDSLELNLLHQLTGLDGVFDIPVIPILGQQNLWTRVLHYRLVVLGLFEGSVTSPFGEISINALQQIRSWLHSPSTKLLAIANQAGHIPLLTAKLLATDRLRKHVVVFKYKSSNVKAEFLQEVDEETEDEEEVAALSEMEVELEVEIAKIDSEIFSGEEAQWEAMENKCRRKQKRVNRIEGRMNKILAVEQKLLTESLTIEVSLQKRIGQLQEQERVLTRSLQQSRRAIKKQKEHVDLHSKNGKKQIKKKEKQQEKLAKQIDDPKDIPQVLALLAQAAQNNRIRSQNIRHLENNNGKKAVIKMLKADLEKTEAEVSRLQTNIKTLKEIQQLADEISTLKGSSTAFDEEQQKLDLLQSDNKKTDDLIHKVNEEIKSKNNKLKLTTQEREQRIGAKQVKLQSLNKRLKRLLEKINGLSYRFKAQLKRSLDDDYYDEIRQKVFRAHSTDYLEQHAETSFNRFLIRLIQVRQWMNGYYYGRLDSQPADRTFQSIVEFTEEEDLPKLRLKYILTKLGQEQKGFWLLNAQYYFECLVSLDSEVAPDNTVELIQVYEESVEKNTAIYNNENTKKAWTEYTRELEEGLDGSEHRIRRFYYGVKSLARSIGRVMNRIICFIVKGVKIVLRILKNFIKIIYKEIREGARNFFDGMNFLFSKRKIETSGANGAVIISDYDFDFDATVFMTNNVPHETLQLHIQSCMSRTCNLHFSLTLCGKILKWVFTLATGSLTWPRMAIKIAFHFKKLVISFFKNRKKKLRSKKA